MNVTTSKLESTRFSYGEVSRHLDFKTLLRISSCQILPKEWEGNEKLELAHRLYWEEQNIKKNIKKRILLHNDGIAKRCQHGDYPV